MSAYIPSWHDPARLAAELRALPALDNAAVERAQGDFLIDACIPGAPLLITFAFVDWNKTADFYLYGRSKKLETLSGQPMNRILLRDQRNLWYLQGVEGLGGNVAEVVKKLQLLIAAMQPSALWCVGESMGGYGAIMHGLLLQAQRIAAFGALSSFNADFAESYGDKRWAPIMRGMNPLLLEASDLPALARRQGYRGQLHLIQGTYAGDGARDAVNLDVMHSRRYADLHCVQYHDYPEAEHAVTHWLNERDRFDAILLHCLFDAPDPAPQPALPAITARTGAPWLRAWPESFPSLNDDIIAKSEDDVLVHRITPHAPLAIVFADTSNDGVVRFDAFPEREYFEARGWGVNCALLRDSRQRAWFGGCEGMGDDIDSVAANLRRLITKCEPSSVVCIGQGTGGFAALLIAVMIGAETVLAFDPLTVLDPQLATLWHDERYLHVLNRLTTQDGPRDLMTALRRYRGVAHIICSAQAQGSSDAGTHGAVHAQRVAMLPCVNITPLPTGQDALGWVRERGLLATWLEQGGITLPT